MNAYLRAEGFIASNSVMISCSGIFVTAEKCKVYFCLSMGCCRKRNAFGYWNDNSRGYMFITLLAMNIKRAVDV